MLTAEALATECIAAANFPAYDPEGNSALLAEAHRRRASKPFDDQFLQMLDVALSPESANLRVLAAFGRHDEPLTKALEGLQSRAIAIEPKYLFHGTLKSRLSSINREGLMPAKHPKNWGPEVTDEHLASGVFFSADWRTAIDWILFRTNGQLAKGAVLRLPAADLRPEKDETARRPGCFVVREQNIAMGHAHVLLPPFTVASRWLTLPEAVESHRQRRKSDQR